MNALRADVRRMFSKGMSEAAIKLVTGLHPRIIHDILFVRVV